MSSRFNLIPWLLSVVLVLGTGTIAQARGQMAAAAFMEICAGQGAAIILVDAKSGQPVSVHSCPDCMAGHGIAVLPDPVPPVRASGWSRVVGSGRAQVVACAVCTGPWARGPPRVA
ncbi:hypothetical protein GCM10011345_21320 [Gemmobacter megaterium]|uniref:hypothetical protein n=1 Tax=Gemmobacter megaterium TaxID=1086013 RepID=UPI0009714C62|nr:hypothetical protein [Gemmobacter megaterium]GGE15171.1 hypothetical protein GCM10011345_21320 [Gemmobacter megaterium]